MTCVHPGRIRLTNQVRRILWHAEKPETSIQLRAVWSPSGASRKANNQMDLNRHGVAAMKWWSEQKPQAFKAMSPQERQTFFSSLGNQVADLILEIEQSMQQENQTGWKNQMAELSTTKREAETRAYATLVWVDPELDQETAPERLDGMPSDLEHPLWAMLDDDQATPVEFRAELDKWRQSVRQERS